MKYILR